MNLKEVEERWGKGFDLYDDEDMKQLHSDIQWLIKRAKKAESLQVKTANNLRKCRSKLNAIKKIIVG